MSAQQPSSGSDPNTEVELEGTLAEFREALRAEIEAARSASQSNAVQLVHGERIGRAADGHQYRFKLKNPQMALADDMPGDLYVPGKERADANVISLAGGTTTLSVSVDLGQHVPNASLSSNLTNLLRKLISRIEDFSESDRENPAGALLLGEKAPSGAPEPFEAQNLNDDQRAAVAAGLGRDVTFIQGPPGTGKTQTIGTLGDQLARRDRSVLLVSHTNTAVDQALLHIARSLGPEVAAEGKILRVGEPKDERVLAQPDLLVKTHVERRSEELIKRRDELAAEREALLKRLLEVERLIAICEWAPDARVRADARRRLHDECLAVMSQLEQVRRQMEAETATVEEWEPRREQARAAQERLDSGPELQADLKAAAEAVEASRAEQQRVADDLSAEVQRRHEQASVEAGQAVENLKAHRVALDRRRAEHVQQLDQARQAVMLTERWQLMPSLQFSEQRAAALRSDEQELQSRVAETKAAVSSAQALLEECRSTGGMTRRLRRLPHPDEQQQQVAATEAAAAKTEADLQAVTSELRVADEQVAETVRLQLELDLLRDAPLEVEVQELLDGDYRDLARAKREIGSAQAVADLAVASAAKKAELWAEAETEKAAAAVLAAEDRVAAAHRELAASAEDVAAFRTEHGAEPAAVLVQAGAALAAHDELTARCHELEDELLQLRAPLREDLSSEAATMSAFGAEFTSLDEDDLLRELTESVTGLLGEAAAADETAIRNEVTAGRARTEAITAEVSDIEEQLEVVEAAVVADATVVATTLTRAYLRDEIQHRTFDTVILDEASMAPIPALWMAAAVSRANVVLVGDPHQLPPIALAADEKDKESPAYRWLARDIFDASGLRQDSAHLVKLRTQYRMHPAISAAPNALVYGGELLDGPNTRDDSELDPWYVRDWGYDAPVLVVDTEKADAWCSAVPAGRGSSRLNFLSAALAVDLAAKLLHEGRKPPKGGEARIIIATPFKPQASLLTLLLRDAGLDGEVIAGTVHSFQGSEAPVVIYDLVLDEPHRRAGLFTPAYEADHRKQFNVGMTRARKRLFILGDLKFLKANGKKAFIGKLLTQLEGSPVVDAEDIAPLGMAARAAEAQARAFGEDAEPSGSERLVITQQDFDAFFFPDLRSAQRRVVIYSPFLTEKRLGEVGPQLRALTERGVHVYVVTKTLEERGKREAQTYRALVNALLRWNVIVVPKKAMHEKLIFIDDDIVWVGSLNALSFNNTREVMSRWNSRRVADDFRRTMQLDIAFQSYEDGETQCPICGEALALAEGPNGPYRTCVTKGCYSRSLSDPPLQEGKLVCSNCGGELYYGAWGDDPAWRCKDNARHRVLVHRNHLKLPAMMAILSGAERKSLEARYS